MSKSGNTDLENNAIKTLLQESSEAVEHDLVEPLADVFSYTQYLLGDDENLTKIGNLNSSAKELLRSRILESFGFEEVEYEEEEEIEEMEEDEEDD